MRVHGCETKVGMWRGIEDLRIRGCEDARIRGWRKRGYENEGTRMEDVRMPVEDTRWECRDVKSDGGECRDRDRDMQDEGRGEGERASCTICIISLVPRIRGAYGMP